MSPRRNVRAAAALLGSTGAASASVIAARLQAFSAPSGAWSAWHQSELQRMVTEKFDAAGEGARAAGMELAMLPYRMLQLGAGPAPWTPAGWMDAWMRLAGLWIGVGNAALRPVRTKAARNRARLGRARRR